MEAELCLEFCKFMNGYEAESLRKGCGTICQM